MFRTPSLKPVASTWIVLSIVSAAFAAETKPARKFAGLGAHGRKISTDSPEAQQFFNQGLAFLYGFNHDEAIRSFEHAATLDPNCAAIHWALSLAHGPHINNPAVDEAHARAAWHSLTKSRERAAQASPVERDLIDALGKRYADPQPDDRRPLDEAYAAAMREVWKMYPQDADVGALFAESMMDLRPWDLWTNDGKPQPGTEEVLKTLETVIAVDAKHPLALHLYIHAVEASPHPEKAADEADRLRDLMPGLGHMVHMASHIDVRLGNWQQAIVANEKALKANANYRAAAAEQGFYRFYMAHDQHMLAFAAMMQGQSERSSRAIQEMIGEIPNEWLEANAAGVDGSLAMPYELHLRFGRWDAMLAEPQPKEIFPIARALWYYARGVAYAANKKVAEAKEEQKHFLKAQAEMPKEAGLTQNSAADVLAIAEKTLAGEILYREGNVDAALESLREAVRLEDNLRYIEPPDWIQPVTHVLGATLMDAKRFAEADEVYQRDLEKFPENGWSLYGRVQCLRKLGRNDEAAAIQARFERAWRHADTKLTSSCLCLPLASE